ncbi:MAG: bifunctional UDP-N-acetylglucosamine diphosphorylase/glucosamine-1-phosphate N-acetyltransferase GlmU, partial [Microbacterium sp.]
MLAAGGGTRMKSKTMKVLHPIAGRSMIGHVLHAASALEPTRIVAVVGNQREQVGPHIEALVPGVVLAVQETQDGTGHAVRIAWEALPADARTGTVIVAYGDTPLLQGESLQAFADFHRASADAVSILTGVVAKPHGYGRIVRGADGGVEAIVEQKDATPEQAAIAEINSGILAFDADFLDAALPRLGNQNANGEYYLTDT